MFRSLILSQTGLDNNRMFKALSILTLVAMGGGHLVAGTITDINFTSNGGSYINDTVPANGTSPLAFTDTTDLAQPFLNAGDSSVSLGFGSYYAISFLGFGQQLGAGTVAFNLDGNPFSENVTFPDNSPAGVTFANFALPGGESVTISTTGLSADRIQVAGDGYGLQPDGVADAFYLFNYDAGTATTTPEPGTLALVGLGVALAGAVKRRRLN